MPLDLKSKQLINIAIMTFWSMFASYTFNAILIVFMTMPTTQAGLGLDDKHAYMLYGVTQSVGYILPVIGGYIADNVLGVRRSISYGALLLSCGYFILVLANQLFPEHLTSAFLLSYALVPIGSSLFLGTASALIGRIYKDDEALSKRGMTVYYVTINVGSMLGIGIAPYLLHSKYGAMSIFIVAFAGKFLAWLNFVWRRRLYDDVLEGADSQPINRKKLTILAGYFVAAYAVTSLLFSHPSLSFYIIGSAIVVTLIYYVRKTFTLDDDSRKKQFFSTYLLLAVFSFFVLYAQMNTSLIMFIKNNSDQMLFGIKLHPSSFQLINPIAIVLIGGLLTRFYKRFPKFNIPYQFATGLIIGAVGIALLYIAGLQQHHGIVSGSYIGLSYFLLTIAELFISAIGLSMISLYCDMSMISFAMGVFYLVVSLAQLVSGRLSELVALPKGKLVPTETLPIYTHFYLYLAAAALVVGLVFSVSAKLANQHFAKQGIALP